MILSGKTLCKLKPVEPFFDTKQIFNGMSFGVSHAGYDIRIAESRLLGRGDFCLASSVEHFTMPNNIIGRVHDKSTLARLGLSVFNTVIEPGWRGFLTLELVMLRGGIINLVAGQPIAQVVFEYVDEEVDGYKGKYQDQEAGPQDARFEPVPTIPWKYADQ